MQISTPFYPGLLFLNFTLSNFCCSLSLSLSGSFTFSFFHLFILFSNYLSHTFGFLSLLLSHSLTSFLSLPISPFLILSPSPSSFCYSLSLALHNSLQGILKGEVSLYRWPPVWLLWISLFCKYKQKLSDVIQPIPNQSNRRSMVQW
jgi:hypothetical protein